MEDGRAARRIWAALAGFIAFVLVLGIASLLRGGRPADRLPVVATLPDFTLVGSDGDAVSRADLEGGLWVADFIFTSCAGICPILSSRMAELQKILSERDIDARLVSISVDPANDTPEALREYAKRYAADPDRWWFLTGERDALYELIGKGFLLSVAERTPGAVDDGGELITHSDRFVLVDRQARIRGYYHGTESESVRRLLEDIEGLVE
jgi:protein SCO1